MPNLCAQGSPGLIFGNDSNPMTGVVFHNVVVNNPGTKPFGTDFFCQDIVGTYSGTTSPVPSCLTPADLMHKQ